MTSRKIIEKKPLMSVIGLNNQGLSRYLIFKSNLKEDAF